MALFAIGKEPKNYLNSKCHRKTDGCHLGIENQVTLGYTVYKGLKVRMCDMFLEANNSCA